MYVWKSPPPMLLRKLFFVFLLFASGPRLFADATKTYEARRFTGSIRIDGKEEDTWRTAAIAEGFTQLEPQEGAVISQETRVKLLYDNTSIYILAHLYDTSPDSILHELGNRDEGYNLNTDAFRIGLDPYNQRQEGYVFEVTASGVQSESYANDFTFDAVWQSAVQLHDKGWTVEVRIPYSALRFPAADKQEWALQFARLIRRNREYDQWSLTKKDQRNGMVYWGTLIGLTDIKPPLRLSLTPYLSIYGENQTSLGENGQRTHDNSYSYSGGADLKYGIDERFTLDLTLLPDFSQVQSDNKIKNIGAFEVIYDERRPFFKEGIELFSRGRLFYSRRVGGTPSGYYDVPYLLNPGESIEENPDKARLVNAVKVSGRTNKGLGIGLFNAVTANTYATIRTADGGKRKILTSPLTNYNILVFDQQLPNNSSSYFINTSVMRDGASRDADVSTGSYTFENKKHTVRISSRYSRSEVRQWVDNPEGGRTKDKKDGSQFSFVADKISGTWQYGGVFEFGDKKFDKNDLSYIFVNDYSDINLYGSYNKFNPFWKHFRQGNLNAWIYRGGRWSVNNLMTQFQGGLNFWLLFNNNWSVYADGGSTFAEGRDYFEPRTYDGRYYVTPMNHWGSINLTTDYNKKLAFDFGTRTWQAPSFGASSYGYYIVPMIRFSDRWSFKVNHNWDYTLNDRGFSTFNSVGNPVFGRRDVLTITNSVTTRYLFKTDMSLSLIMRHYFSQGDYDRYYDLGNAGELVQNDGYLNPSVEMLSTDFRANYFNVDLVYNWVFSPGSSLIITYKNQIAHEDSAILPGYFRNLSNTIEEPQTNSISVKVLYFLDWEYLKRHRS